MLNLLSLNVMGHSGKSTNLFIILNKRQSLKYLLLDCKDPFSIYLQSTKF